MCILKIWKSAKEKGGETRPMIDNDTANGLRYQLALLKAGGNMWA